MAKRKHQQEAPATGEFVTEPVAVAYGVTASSAAKAQGRFRAALKAVARPGTFADFRDLDELKTLDAASALTGRK